MKKHGKKYQEAAKKVKSDGRYSITEASSLVKELSYSKFDAEILKNLFCPFKFNAA